MPDKDENSSDKALMALIDEHEPLLRGIIQLEVQNPVDADDVFQETVFAILEHFRAGKPVENPRAWMVQIAKNRCVDFHRQLTAFMLARLPSHTEDSVAGYFRCSGMFSLLGPLFRAPGAITGVTDKTGQDLYA